MSAKGEARLKYLTVEDVALELNVCTKTIRRLIDRGKIVATRIGSCLRISQEDLGRYLARCRG